MSEMYFNYEISTDDILRVWYFSIGSILSFVCILPTYK